MERLTNRKRMVLEDLSRFLQIHNIKFERIEDKVMVVDSDGDLMMGKVVDYKGVNSFLDHKGPDSKTCENCRFCERDKPFHQMFLCKNRERLNQVHTNEGADISVNLDFGCNLFSTKEKTDKC